VTWDPLDRSKLGVVAIGGRLGRGGTTGIEGKNGVLSVFEPELLEITQGSLMEKEKGQERRKMGPTFMTPRGHEKKI